MSWKKWLRTKPQNNFCMSLKKLFKLVNESGQPCFIADPDSDNVFVLIDLERYEAMNEPCDCDCYHDEMLDAEIEESIQHDIALMKEHDAEQARMMQSEADQPAEEFSGRVDEEDRFYLEPVE